MKNLIDKNQEIWYNTIVSKWIADEQQTPELGIPNNAEDNMKKYTVIEEN